MDFVPWGCPRVVGLGVPWGHRGALGVPRRGALGVPAEANPRAHSPKTALGQGALGAAAEANPRACSLKTPPGQGALGASRPQGTMGVIGTKKKKKKVGGAGIEPGSHGPLTKRVIHCTTSTYY